MEFYIYKEKVLRPFLDFLVQLGPDEFNRIFQADINLLSPQSKSWRKIIPQVTETLLQRDYQNRYYESAYHDLLSFQTIVDSIYYTILQHNIRQLSTALIPPMVRWERSCTPHTFTVRSTNSSVNIQAGVVCLPPELRAGEVTATSGILHEVGGHNILQSCTNLVKEIQTAIRREMTADGYPEELVEYWAQCAEEMTSDITGLFHSGPSFVASFMTYFRSLRGGKLQTDGQLHTRTRVAVRALHLHSTSEQFTNVMIHQIAPTFEIPSKPGRLGFNGEIGVDFTPYVRRSSAHPVDFMRVLVMTHVLSQMTFDASAKDLWTRFIHDEIERDLRDVEEITLKEVRFSIRDQEIISHVYPIAQMRLTAQSVGRAIVLSNFPALDGQTLLQLFGWTTRDHNLTDKFKRALLDGDLEFIPPEIEEGAMYARYIVAAATEAYFEEGANHQMIFERMKQMLLIAQRRANVWRTDLNVPNIAHPPEDPAGPADTDH